MSQKESKSNNYTQLCFLEYVPSQQEVVRVIEQLTERCEKLRKKFHATDNYKDRKIEELEIRMNHIESNICKIKK